MPDSNGRTTGGVHIARLAVGGSPAERGACVAERPGFELHHLWMLSVATVTLQATSSFWLVRGELRHRLEARLAAAPP